MNLLTRTAKERVETMPPVSGPEFGSYLGLASPLPEKPTTLNIFPIEGGAEYLAEEALQRDLSEVVKLRFDPINKCNLSCIFCPSDMRGKSRQIHPDTLGLLLKRIAKTCRRIIIGCRYEALMAKNLVEYGNVLRNALNNEFSHQPIVSLMTNGMLLGVREIETFMDFVSWLHISIASHRKEHFEKIERKADFDVLCQNVRNVLNRYDKVRIHTEMIANRINMHDVNGFITWVFKELRVDTLNIRRVETQIKCHPNSNIAHTLRSGYPLGLSDDEWSQIVERVRAEWPVKISGVTIDDNNCRLTPVIELTRSECMANLNVEGH